MFDEVKQKMRQVQIDDVTWSLINNRREKKFVVWGRQRKGFEFFFRAIVTEIQSQIYFFSVVRVVFFAIRNEKGRISVCE